MAQKADSLTWWDWVAKVQNEEDITEEHIHRCYRLVGGHAGTCAYKCSGNCRRNPKCYWGLGEKQWIAPKEDSKKEDKGLDFRNEDDSVGLINLGTTCYVNSLLQLWYHNPVLRSALFKWRPGPVDMADVDNYQPNNALGELQAIFARMKLSKRKVVDPTNLVVEHLDIDTREQQDAQEFASLFHSLLVGQARDTEAGAELINAFQGDTEWVTTCKECKRSKTRPDTFCELNLGVQDIKTLESSFEALLAEEEVSDDNLVYCEYCCKKTNCTRRQQIVSLPPVLQLQLLRFIYDTSSLRRKKVTTMHSYPKRLDMRPHVKNADGRGDNVCYDYVLTGYLVHSGQSASSGHYVAHIRSLSSKEWKVYNDDSVSASTTRSTGDVSESDGQYKSSGAYMLVYLRRDLVENNYQDPELPRYLSNLVTRENLQYEESVRHTQEKRLEKKVLEAEKRQIVKELYNQLLPPTEESDSENAPSPAEEVVIMNGNGIHSKGKNGNAKGPSRKDKEALKKNMDEIVRRKAQVFNKKYSVDKLLFISATSFSTWLRDTESLEIPMDNQEILCQHNKLRPPSSCVLSQSTLAIKYKAIPYSVYQGANQLFSQNKEESSALLHGPNAFCEICVRDEFRTIKKFTLLEQRIKIYSDESAETQKKIENFSKRSADLDHQDSFWENKMWISNASHRKWKNWVKSRFDPEKLVDSGAPANVNKDIECEHGYLNLEESQRRVISVKAWTILLEYFPGSTQFPVRHSEGCEICRNEMQNELIRIRDKKKVAAELSETFHDLRKGINRPKPTIAGTYYYVSEQFFQKFLTFLKAPEKNEIPDVMDNSDLVCEHNKFKYPYELHESVALQYEKVNSGNIRAFSGLPEYKPPWQLLNDNEWAAFISLNIPYNQVVSVTVENAMKLTYEPDQCYTCALAWSDEILEELYCFIDQPVFLRSLEPEKEEKPDVYIVEDDDDDKDDFVPHKRGINRKRPVSPQPRPEINDGSVRRSSRSKVANKDKRVLCNSTDTVHQLKKKLVQELNYTKCASDIALFVDDRCLSDSASTLREYKIHPNCIVLYATDAASPDDAVEAVPPERKESGFANSKLHQGNVKAAAKLSMVAEEVPSSSSSSSLFTPQMIESITAIRVPSNPSLNASKSSNTGASQGIELMDIGESAEKGVKSNTSGESRRSGDMEPMEVVVSQSSSQESSQQSSSASSFLGRTMEELEERIVQDDGEEGEESNGEKSPILGQQR